ncbi:hypothetical protein JCM3765_003403 [Sporobolomyces pararoseus]
MPPKASTSSETPIYTHWLIKAEPDSRIEKGVDVKFSIEDFEKCKVSSWEGVRNHQAKKYLKTEMKLSQECLFYASNCKKPGITGIAKIVKEGYPDFNAWDPNHPYYDPKSKKDDPTWYMVDVEFVSRLPNLVPLSLLQYLSTLSTTPTCLSHYLTSSNLNSISESVLLKRGRLSVQPCTKRFFETVKLLGEKGGFQELLENEVKNKGKSKVKGKGKEPKEKAKEEEVEDQNDNDQKFKGKKRKVEVETDDDEEEKEKPSPSKSSSRKTLSKSRKVSKRESEDEVEEEEESEEEKMPTRGTTASNARHQPHRESILGPSSSRVGKPGQWSNHACSRPQHFKAISTSPQQVFNGFQSDLSYLSPSQPGLFSPFHHVQSLNSSQHLTAYDPLELSSNSTPFSRRHQEPGINSSYAQLARYTPPNDSIFSPLTQLESSTSPPYPQQPQLHFSSPSSSYPLAPSMAASTFWPTSRRNSDANGPTNSASPPVFISLPYQPPLPQVYKMPEMPVPYSW